MISDAVSLTLTANEGVLISRGDFRLLADGLHHGGGGFSPVSPDLLAQTTGGEGPFSQVPFLFFSHCHPDHFAPDAVEAYLLANDVQALFLPAREGERLPQLLAAARSRHTQVRLLDTAPGRARLYSLAPGATLAVFSSPHAGGVYSGVSHYCGLVELGGFRLLLLGDSDYVPDYFQAMTASVEVDVLLVNPLFLNKEAGRQVIQAIGPRRLVVYHLPFAKDDRMNLRATALRDLERFPDLPPAQLLLEEGQTLLL